MVKTKSVFSTNLTNLMKQKDLSLKNAAEISGAPISTIQEWRTSSHSPSDIIAAKKLANYFGITLATLLTGEPDKLSRVNPDEFFSDEETVFDGYAKITIQRIRFKQIKKHHQE